jgi:UDP-N-acetylmuramate dehydrogenase
MQPQKNIPLRKYSTFGIGGVAELFFHAKNPQEIMRGVVWANRKKIPVHVFAGGSNVFFTKSKISGFIMRIYGGKIEKNGNVYTVDSGVLLDVFVKRSLRDGCVGVESLTAIPGTIGGAVYGNAGAYGRSISDVVRRIQVFDGEKIFWVKKNECKFGYRDSIFKRKKWYILRVEILLKKDKNKKAIEESKKIRLIRNKKYPQTLKCPGSFFKNVLIKSLSQKTINKIDKSKILEGKIPAGYLLESVGAKGMSVGGIWVADYHGNLFINKRSGTARDVEKISEILKKRVKKKFGVLLEEEVVRF